MPVLDTTFLIDLQRKDPVAVAALRAIVDLDLIVAGQTAKEFAAGFDEPLTAWHLVNENYRIVLEGQDQILMAARLHRKARAKRHRPGWADTSIASQAHLSATYVVTANPSDFAALECTVWDYRKDARPPA